MAESNTQDQPQTPGESSAPSFRDNALARLSAERAPESDADQPEQLTDEAGDEGQTEDESQSFADQTDDGTDGEESTDQPDPDEAPEVFNVDGDDYSAADVRELVDSRKRWDVEFRRKSQITARLKQEYEAAGQEMEAKSLFFTSLVNNNAQQMERVDTSQMSPEQFQAFHNQRSMAQQGQQRLQSELDNLLGAVNTKKKELSDRIAGESIDVLKGIEPRWSDSFYTDVREFAINSGRYSAEDFNEITDWRTIEGLVALMDRDTVKKPRREKPVNENKRPSRRNQAQRKRARNARGQYQGLQQTVAKSHNAKADGSFQAMKRAQLATERGE